MKDSHLKLAIELKLERGTISQAFLMRKMRISAVEANRIMKEIEHEVYSAY